MSGAPYVDADDAITDRLWNDFVDWVLRQAEVRVAPPLVVRDGVIMNADEFKVSHAKTTAQIDAASSTSMSSGPADLYFTDQAGKFIPRDGFKGRTVWNDLAAPIPSGTILRVMWYDGKWQIFNSNCLGG